MPQHVGRHFLHIPGPTNVPVSVLRAIAEPTIDHRGPEFAELVADLLPRLGRVFGAATDPVVTYASSGTGAWEAALVNTLSAGDTVLAFDHGHFASLWSGIAERLGVRVERVACSWRRGVDPVTVEARLAADRERRIRAVLVVHNETSTGVTSRVAEVRKAIDAAGHPALLLVDSISSLGSIEYRHDAWGVDVTVGGSQKGLMLPPGIAFNVISEKALEAAATARLPRAYWDWRATIDANRSGRFPATPATNLLFGLRESLTRIETETIEGVLQRHKRLADATRAAVRGWGLELVCEDPRECSNSLTAVMIDDEHDADRVRELILEHFDLSLGGGLGPLAGRVIRIGHLGDLNDLTLLGALCGIEMGLRVAGVRIVEGGVTRALRYLEDRLSIV